MTTCPKCGMSITSLFSLDDHERVVRAFGLLRQVQATLDSADADGSMAEALEFAAGEITAMLGGQWAGEPSADLILQAHGSHGEANEDTGAAPDTSQAVAGHGDTSRAPRRKVRRVRFRGWNGEDHGTVEWVGGKIVMSDDAAAFCATVNVFHPGWRRPVTPADGRHYLHGLLASFRGPAFWAEIDE